VLVRSEDAAYYAWVLAALSPWAYVEQPKHKGTGKLPPPLATLAAREGIKATNKLCDVVTGSERHRGDIMTLKNAICEKASYVDERDRLGMAIRGWEARGGHWRLQVLSALLVEAIAAVDGTKKPVAYDQLLAGWQTFLDHLQELDLMEAPSLKRLIDGTQLAKALGVKPGKWMNKAMDICMEWQLRNPTATDPAGAVDEVRSRADEIEGYPRK
jgi:tRNA nucleotidyltransferase (CCA-adding enzyme)